MRQNSGLFTAMTIYVNADGNLVCSPYGRDRGIDLVYEGVNPLTTDKWQHISCSFLKGKFVKGQYLAINLDYDVNSDFADAILYPQTFA